MDKICKYQLKITDSQIIEMPADAVILSAGLDPVGNVCIWSIGSSKLPEKIGFEIRIVGTGNPLPRLGSFIGTVRDGAAIWHIFTGPGNSAGGVSNGFHYQTRGNE